MRRVALLLAMAWPMSAQFPLYLDLAGEWRIGPSDDPLYARADVDDGDWQRYSLPRTRPIPMSDTRWLRHRVEIPAGADTSSLVLTMGPVSEVYELYVNGVRVGSRGGWKLSQVTPARPEQFTIPPSLLTAGTSAVIAMRVWRPFFLGPAYRTQHGRAADTGPYLLTSRENAPRDVAAAIERKRERLALESLITGEFYLIVALLLVLAWVTERQRREVFLMVAYLGAEAVFRLSNYLSFLMDWTFQAQVINGFLISLASTLMALLAMKLAGWAPRWLRAVAWLQLLWHAGTNAIVWSSDIDYKGFRSAWLLGPLGAVLLLGLIYGTIQAVRRAVRQREGWPWLLLLSMMVVLLRFHAYQSMYFFQGLPRAILRIEALEIEFQGYDVASVVLTLAIAALLLQRMGADRREKARLSAEMEAARLVQESLLGAAASATPGFTVDAAYLPASEVGGDFHIEVQRDDGSLLVLVGDVSGKGLRAALLVGHVSGVVHGQRSRRPAEVLANLNDSLVGRVGGGFVTCCCARFEWNGRVSIANAGHLPPYSAGNEVAVEGGLPLGVVPGVEYAEMETAIEGAMLFLSDGVVEAANAQGELFGFERTRLLSGKAASEIAEAAREWGQNDDITVVTVRRAV